MNHIVELDEENPRDLAPPNQGRLGQEEQDEEQEEQEHEEGLMVDPPPHAAVRIVNRIEDDDDEEEDEEEDEDEEELEYEDEEGQEVVAAIVAASAGSEDLQRLLQSHPIHVMKEMISSAALSLPTATANPGVAAPAASTTAARRPPAYPTVSSTSLLPRAVTMEMERYRRLQQQQQGEQQQEEQVYYTQGETEDDRAAPFQDPSKSPSLAAPAPAALRSHQREAPRRQQRDRNAAEEAEDRAIFQRQRSLLRCLLESDDEHDREQAREYYALFPEYSASPSSPAPRKRTNPDDDGDHHSHLDPENKNNNSNSNKRMKRQHQEDERQVQQQEEEEEEEEEEEQEQEEQERHQEDPAASASASEDSSIPNRTVSSSSSPSSLRLLSTEKFRDAMSKRLLQRMQSDVRKAQALERVLFRTCPPSVLRASYDDPDEALDEALKQLACVASAKQQRQVHVHQSRLSILSQALNRGRCKTDFEQAAQIANEIERIRSQRQRQERLLGRSGCRTTTTAEGTIVAGTVADTSTTASEGRSGTTIVSPMEQILYRNGLCHALKHTPIHMLHEIDWDTLLEDARNDLREYNDWFNRFRDAATTTTKMTATTTSRPDDERQPRGDDEAKPTLLPTDGADQEQRMK